MTETVKHTPPSASEIRAAWESINGAPDTDSETDKCARFLLAIGAVGSHSLADISDLSGLSGIDVHRLKTKAEQLGLLVNGVLHHSGWFDDEKGGIAFILDVMTLEGAMERVAS